MNIDKSIQGCLSSLKLTETFAKRSKEKDEETLDHVMNPFVVDSDVKIPGSKGFRKLSDKTQVLTSPWNGLVRNRNSHTMEVVGVATTISSILGLNTNLVRAIAIGHDIGHVPFGHIGEAFISTVTGKQFRHEVFGVVLAQKIERKGDGLNATHPTLSGILHHSRGSGLLKVSKEMSQEAVVAMYSDKFDYITADYNDISKRLRLPDSWLRPVTQKINELGMNQRMRINTLITGLCESSFELGQVDFSASAIEKIFNEVKSLMYGIYPKLGIYPAEDFLIRVLCYLERLFGKEKAILILALMTDNDILSLARKNTFDISDLELTSIWEQKDYILNLPLIDMFDPGLD